MAEASVPAKYIDELTECPICRQVLNDPIGLPCFHTFCLKCINGWAAKRKTEEQKKSDGQNKLTCPLCRKEIDATREQIAQLPRNPFIEKLLEIRKLSSSFSDGAVACDVCAGRAGNSTPPVAVVYCVECRQNLCSQCSDYHGNISVLSSHRRIQLHSDAVGSAADDDDLLIKFSDEACDKHRGEQLKIYCLDCKTVLCLMCFIKDHKSHNCSDVNEVAEELKRNVKSDGDGVDAKAGDLKRMISKLDTRKKTFMDKTNKTHDEIVVTAEKLKTTIEQRKTELLRELEQAKKTELKQIENTREELEGRLMMINSFKKYSDQLREKGSACDLARQAADLRTRAKELLVLGCAGDLEADIAQLTDIAYSSAVSLSQLREIMGKLTVTTTNKAQQGQSVLVQDTSSGSVVQLAPSPTMPAYSPNSAVVRRSPKTPASEPKVTSRSSDVSVSLTKSAPSSPSSDNSSLIPVLVAGLTERTLSFVISPTDTVDRLKSLIEQRHGIATDKQRLIYSGKELQDGILFNHYGVLNNSTIHFYLRFS